MTISRDVNEALREFDRITNNAAEHSFGVAICRHFLATDPHRYMAVRLMQLNKTFADVLPNGLIK